MKYRQNTKRAPVKLLSPAGLILIILMATVSNAFAACKVCLGHLGCEITSGECTEKRITDMLAEHQPASCLPAVIASSPSNYLLYDKVAAKAWLVEGTKKTPIAGSMTPDVLNRWISETGLRLESANRTKK